jgi:hypothetical protein
MAGVARWVENEDQVGYWIEASPPHRAQLSDSDFVFSDERKFPVLSPDQVMAAVNSWGRYKGPHSFDEFKSALIALAHRKGAAYIAELPKSWNTKEAGYEPAPYHQEPDETVTCPVCGKADAPDAIYCDQCGTELAGRSDVQQGTEAETVTDNDRLEGRVLEAKTAAADGQRVFRVEILRYGDSKNRKRYTESVMRRAAPRYEGAKAYDHHRTEEELQTSTTAGLVGSYRNVEATPRAIEADLVLLPSARHTAEALDASLHAQARGLPPLVGISHDVMAAYKPIQVGGQRFLEATEIVSVNSADVVADPAAGGQVTRMVAGGSADDSPHTSQEDEMNLKQLLELLRNTKPEARAALLQEHASVIEASGYSADEVSALIPVVESPEAPATQEPAKAPEPALAGVAAGPAEQATESRYGRDTLIGRQLVRAAMDDKGLDVRYLESVSRLLPEAFTEDELLRTVEAKKADLADFERDLIGRTGGRITEGVRVTADELDKKKARLEASFDGRWSEGYTSLKDAFVDITGEIPRSYLDEDFNRRILEASYGDDGHGGGYWSSMRGTESVSASTWGTILGDSITRRMVAEYSQPNLMNWRAIVSSVVPVNDFRTQRIERMGGYGVLPGVNEAGPYQSLTSPGNEEVTYSISKRGGLEDLTLETIANDDLRAVTRIPVKLGLAAAQTVYRFVWDFLGSNPTVYDSTALFAAGHNNTATGEDLSQAALTAARVAMRKQSAYGDTKDILMLEPKYLVTPANLEGIAWQLCTSAVALPSGSAGAESTGAANTPNINQSMTPIVVPYFDSTHTDSNGNSISGDTATSYVIADPSLCPTIELGFYQGRQEPELFVQNDPTVGSVFQADKITWKIRHIYSGAVLDFRAFYRMQH